MCLLIVFCRTLVLCIAASSWMYPKSQPLTYVSSRAIGFLMFSTGSLHLPWDEYKKEQKVYRRLTAVFCRSKYSPEIGEIGIRKLAICGFVSVISKCSCIAVIFVQYRNGMLQCTKCGCGYVIH